MLNNPALDNLPTGIKQADIPAYLTDRDGKILFTFLYNPYKINYTKRAAFSEVPILGNKIQPQFYLHTEGTTVSFTDLLMDGYCDNKDISPLIQQLEDLLKSPQPVYFSWGNGIFGPSILQEASWEVDLFLSGKPARARCNLTLKEIPGVESSTTTQSVATSRESLKLTTRQRERGQKEASDYLQSNLNTIKPNISQVLRNKNFVIKVGESGLVSLYDGKSNLIAEVGNYNGRTFTPSAEVLL